MRSYVKVWVAQYQGGYVFYNNKRDVNLPGAIVVYWHLPTKGELINAMNGNADYFANHFGSWFFGEPGSYRDLN